MKKAPKVTWELRLFWRLVPFYGTDIFFRLKPGCHDLMTAAQTTEPKICTGPQYQPPLFPAGMGLFHNQNVV
jgi:hypothetical protein